jgi:hypothetical protein
VKALALVALGLVGGCSGPTELLLVVQGNLTPPTLGAVQVQVTDDVNQAFADGFSSAPTCVCVDPTACTGSLPRATMPLTIPLDPGHQGTTPFEIAVSGFGAPDCDSTDDIIDASAVVHFVEHERLGVYVSLDGACVGVECEEGFTCKAGTCMPNDSDPTPLEDMASSPPSTTKDLSVLSTDMATSPTFTLLTAAPSLWSVALGGGMSALGYVSPTADPADTGFDYGTGTDPSKYVSARLSAAANSVCAVYDQVGARFLFGVATQNTITVYGSGGAVSGFDPAGVSVYTASSTTVSQLQCARSQDGVVFAWLESSTLGGTGANGQPAHAPSNPPMIKLVDITPGKNNGPPVISSPTPIASATAFELAASGFYASGTSGPSTVPVSVLFVSDGTQYMGGKNKPCMNSVLFSYDSASFGSPSVTTCVPLDPTKGLDAVATAGATAGAIGYRSNKTEFGAASSPLQSVSMAAPAQLAIAPIGPSSFVMAFTAQGSTELDLYEGPTDGTPPLSKRVVRGDVTTSSPVELASDESGRTYVTWVSSNMLLGLISP